MVFAILVNASASIALASDVPSPCPPSAFAKFAPPRLPSPQNIAVFDREIGKPVATIQALRVSPDVVQSIGQFHRHGAFAGLTVEVQTADGPKFLKVFDGLTLAATAQSHVIQNALARENLAPKVTGYLTRQDVKALLRKFPDLDEGDDDVKLTYGVLMDRIDSARSQAGLNETPPTAMTKPELAATLKNLEATMAKLRIFPPQDLQYTFDRAGKFWLYDFDAYGHISTEGFVTNLDSPDGQRTLEEFVLNRYIEVQTEAKKRPTDRFFIDAAGKFRVRLARLRNQLLGE